MYLIYGVLVLFAVVLFWLAALILCRRPGAGWYGKDSMQAYFWTPVAASLLCLGLLMVMRAFFKFSPSGLELILSAITVAIIVATYRFLSKWVPAVDVPVAGTETKVTPFEARDISQKTSSDHAEPRDNHLKRAA